VPEEKSIERFDCETEKIGSGYVYYEQGVMEPWPEGEWVKYEEHRQALGEAASALSAELAKVRKHRDDLKEALSRAPYPSDLSIAEQDRDLAEQKLQTITAEIAYVRGHLEAYADALDRPHSLQELKKALREDASRLLDQAETAGAE